MGSLPRWRCSILLLALGAVRCLAQTAPPRIDKIDPPDWFTGMPDALLLVHGEHLENTRFAFRARVSAGRKPTDLVQKTSVSANGHWAFVTLASTTARAGQFELFADNTQGSTSAGYRISPRRKTAGQPKGFSSADVMYLVMPDRFADGDPANDQVPGFPVPDDRTVARAYHGGDLRGVEQHLDYLRQMGVTTVWTTPLYDNSAAQSGQTYHGYSASDMYRVDPHFGSMADYRALTGAAHARGMKVVLDTVPNHVGAASPWAADAPAADWLHGTPEQHEKVDDDFASVTDPAASAARRSVLLNGWFANVLPDLNQDNPLVAQYLLQNAIWWIESAGLDGLRLDTFPYVPRSFWHGYEERLHSLYPGLTSVGEVFHGDPQVTSFFAGGRANAGSDGSYDTLLDTPFDYPMFFALRGALTHHRPMSAIADVLRSDALYPHPERLVTFIGNHDTKRFLSEPGGDTAGLRLAFGLLATLRGMPQLYYGDEIGMEGGDDPDNRKDFPGGFAGDAQNAFSSAGRTAAQQSMYGWVTSLMQLRGHTPVLQTGQQEVLLADQNTLAFGRSMDRTGDCVSAPQAARYLVVANNDPQAREIQLAVEGDMFHGCTRYARAPGAGAILRTSDGLLKVDLGGQEIAIFRALP